MLPDVGLVNCSDQAPPAAVVGEAAHTAVLDTHPVSLESKGRSNSMFWFNTSMQPFGSTNKGVYQA